MINSEGPHSARIANTLHAPKFTPEVLLSAPRRSAAIPNSSGTHALYSVSTYSFESHSKSSELRLLDISTGHSTLITNNSKASEPTWLGDSDHVLFLQGGENGSTSLVLIDALATNSYEIPVPTRLYSS